MSLDSPSPSALSPVAVSTAPAVEPRTTERWHSVGQCGPLMAAGVAFVLCYRDVFPILYQQWTTIDANSHGFLIPLLSVYLVWSRRHVLARMQWRPAPAAGLAVVLSAMSAFAFGSLSETVTIQELSMLPAIAGVVVALYGWAVLRRVWMAILYLAFMMPLLDPFAAVHPPLQSFAATVGGTLLAWGGIPVLRSDSMIYMPNAALEVARACSGVNNLVAILAIGIAIAELTFVRRRVRIGFVAFALLVALFANPARVALIGALLYLGYETYLPGTGHEVQGFIVSAGAFLLLAGGASLFSRLFDRPGALPLSAEAAASSPSVAGRASLRHWAVASMCAAALIAGGAHPSLIARVEAAPVFGTADRASHVGEWRAESSVSPVARDLRTLPASLDPTIYRRGAAADVVAVVTAPLFGAGAGGDTMASLVGTSEPVTVMGPGSRPIRVNRTVLRSSARRFDVLYWYEVNGDILDNRIEARLRGAVGRLMRPSVPPTVVAVMAPAAEDGALPAALVDLAGALIATEDERFGARRTDG